MFQKTKETKGVLYYSSSNLNMGPFLQMPPDNQFWTGFLLLLHLYLHEYPHACINWLEPVSKLNTLNFISIIIIILQFMILLSLAKDIAF